MDLLAHLPVLPQEANTAGSVVGEQLHSAPREIVVEHQQMATDSEI